jgi:hypothetical protein
MRVYIKTKNKRRFFIPIPMPTFLIRLVLSNYGKSKVLKHIDKDSRRYIENLDFKALGKGISDIKEYKGLKLVEVSTKSGEEITIII